MERYAWKARVIEGKLDEYIKRHNEIWPELVDVLKQAGIKNYTIWNVDNTLFGYYECEKGVGYGSRNRGSAPFKKCVFYGISHNKHCNANKLIIHVKSFKQCS